MFIGREAGFTDSCIDNAEKLGNVTLVTYKDIISSFDLGESPTIFPVIRRPKK